ncbi:MAG: nitrilase family protein, partial [Flavobacteriaceae bacterium]|nr:nitrilase family protein [Flavobacteriaceae bacterium]
MKEVLKISIIQSDLFWENPAANRLMFSEKINQISEQTDLIVLPEMFTTGFTMNALPLAELENGKTLIWMKHQAVKMDCAVTGSVIISKNESFY